MQTITTKPIEKHVYLNSLSLKYIKYASEIYNIKIYVAFNQIFEVLWFYEIVFDRSNAVKNFLP